MTIEDYKTNLFKTANQSGIVEAKDLCNIMGHIHDIFVYAASHGLNVYTLCDVILSPEFNALYVRETEKNVACSIRDVLHADHSAYFLLWCEQSSIQSLLSTSVRGLMAERRQAIRKFRRSEYAEGSPLPGSLGIRVSGLASDPRNVPHHIVATDLREHWIVRRELPRGAAHRFHASPEELTLYSQVVLPWNPAAKELGKRVYTQFRELYEAIPRGRVAST